MSVPKPNKVARCHAANSICLLAESSAAVACFLARYRSRAADTDVSVLRRAIFFGLAGSGSGGAGGGGRGGGGEGEGVRWGSSSSPLVEFRSLSSSLPWSLFDLSGSLSSGGGGSCSLFFFSGTRFLDVFGLLFFFFCVFSIFVSFDVVCSLGDVLLQKVVIESTEIALLHDIISRCTWRRSSD